MPPGIWRARRLPHRQRQSSSAREPTALVLILRLIIIINTTEPAALQAAHRPGRRRSDRMGVEVEDCRHVRRRRDGPYRIRRLVRHAFDELTLHGPIDEMSVVSRIPEDPRARTF